MKSYQIVYAVAVWGSLEIETADFDNEADARVGMATLRNMPRGGRRQVISATLAGPDDEVIEEYDA